MGAWSKRMLTNANVVALIDDWATCWHSAAIGASCSIGQFGLFAVIGGGAASLAEAAESPAVDGPFRTLAT